jgi:arylsulfatase A-like enzyme
MRRLADARLTAAVALTAALLCVGCDRAGTPPPKRAARVTQVVLITIDTLRADRLGTYGYEARPTSPTIDAWADQAAVFERAFSQAPWTIPSLGSLMTGFYPSEVGVYTNRAHIDPDFVTLAQLFRQRGFRTASFNTHYLLLGEYTGFRRGFEEMFPEAVAPTDSGVHKLPFALAEPALMSWLERRAAEPFFVWIHDMSPHEPPTEGNVYLKDPFWGRGGEYRQYDPEIRWMDDLLSRIFARLKALGIWDKALIIFTADHGEAFLEHDLRGHQDVIYDEVLRVPLIVQYPGMKRPQRIVAPVELLDVFQTIAELADLDVPVDSRGESLVPLLDGKRSERERPFLFHSRYHFEHGEHHLAVRDSEWKLIVKTPPSAQQRDDPPDWGLFAPGTTYELYHVDADPEELENVIDRYSDVALRLGQALWAWKQLTAQQVHLGPKRAPRELDAATREALRALGYGD